MESTLKIPLNSIRNTINTLYISDENKNFLDNTVTNKIPMLQMFQPKIRRENFTETNI